jgi:hypothetical protein
MSAVPRYARIASTTSTIEPISTSAVTAASQYCSGNRTGRRGAMVLRRTLRHMVGESRAMAQTALS